MRSEWALGESLFGPPASGGKVKEAVTVVVVTSQIGYSYGVVWIFDGGEVVHCKWRCLMWRLNLDTELVGAQLLSEEYCEFDHAGAK